MDIKPIRSEADYTAALADIEQYFLDEPEPGSAAGDRFEVLLALIGAYEREHWAIVPPDPVSAILEVMSRRKFTQKDFAALLGSKSRASEILNRRRNLTFDQARLLHDKWQVPAEALLAASHINDPA